MSSRIRIYATHPQYGQFVGPEAKRQIIALNLCSPSLRFEFKNTAKYVKQLGEETGWQVRLFRVPKGIKLAKTEWGRFLASVGMFPRSVAKKKNVEPQIARPQAVPAGVPAGNNDFDNLMHQWGQLGQIPQPPGAQNAQQAMAQNQVGYRFQYHFVNANGELVPMAQVQNNPADEVHVNPIPLPDPYPDWMLDEELPI